MLQLQDDGIELLIEEIEKRPTLFDKSLKEYANNNLRRELWEEICVIVVPDWLEMTPENRIKAGIEIQKKWQNLRSCFCRELRLQKQTKINQSSSKRRKYVYFEKLLFLIPTMESRSKDKNETLSHDDEDGLQHINESDLQRPRKQNIQTKAKQAYEETLLNVSPSQNKYDEDVHFALSLVPSLKKLDQTNKLEAKIQILSVIKDIWTHSSGINDSTGIHSYKAEYIRND